MQRYIATKHGYVHSVLRDYKTMKRIIEVDAASLEFTVTGSDLADRPSEAFVSVVTELCSFRLA